MHLLVGGEGEVLEDGQDGGADGGEEGEVAPVAALVVDGCGAGREVEAEEAGCEAPGWEIS